MRFKFIVIHIFLACALLVGCSSVEEMKADQFYDEDLCVVDTEDSRIKICYGMAREAVEKLLGEGVEMSLGREYEHGLDVYYRDDKVSGFILSEDSLGYYETARGLHFKSNIEEITEAYGSTHMLQDPYGYYYVFRIDDKKAMGRNSLKADKSIEDMENVFIIDISVHNERVSDIWLMDQRLMNEDE